MVVVVVVVVIVVSVVEEELTLVEVLSAVDELGGLGHCPATPPQVLQLLLGV